MWVSRVTVGLARAGGALVLGLAVLVTVSVLGRWMVGWVVPGDFELVQIGIAVATFAFLPLCQLRGHNIVVDTFTTRLPERARAILDTLWALVYFGVACLLAARMAVGARDTFASGDTSMGIGLPIGWGVLAAALLSAWLAVVVLVTAVRAQRGGRP